MKTNSLATVNTVSLPVLTTPILIYKVQKGNTYTCVNCNYVLVLTLRARRKVYLKYAGNTVDSLTDAADNSRRS